MFIDLFINGHLKIIKLAAIFINRWVHGYINDNIFGIIFDWTKSPRVEVRKS